jgi:hypothetical protein
MKTAAREFAQADQSKNRSNHSDSEIVAVYTVASARCRVGALTGQSGV